jgi:hypothetical protein
MNPKRIILRSLVGAALLAAPIAPFGGQVSLIGVALAHGGNGNGGGGGRGGHAGFGGAGGAEHAGMGHAPNQSRGGCGGSDGPYTGPGSNHTSGC